MKKESNLILIAIFIVAILLVLDLASCEKNELVQPEKQELTIEALAYSIIPENIDFNVALTYGEYKYLENKNFTLQNNVNQIVFKRVIYINKDEIVNLKIDCSLLKNSSIFIIAYTDSGHPTFKELKPEMTISLVDNAFKNVVIE